MLVLHMTYFYSSTAYFHLSFILIAPVPLELVFQHPLQYLSVHLASTDVPQQRFSCEHKEWWGKGESAWRQGFF